ncbi:MAG: DUF4118 domain-containing protein [Saprospiraceae bacterium]|nr:DUF4118 domain-containing protein [Saprospiraceae bacterium]
MRLVKTRKLPIYKQYFLSIGAVLLVSALCFYFSGYMGYKMVALWLLMTVSLLAMMFEILPVLVSAMLSALIWNYFFIPPLFTFHIGDAEDALMFLLYFIIALVNATLTIKIRQAERKARDKEEKEKTILLYNTLLNSLSHELKTPIATIQGSVDTLLADRDKLTTENQLELLHEIDTASLRLNRQVENLLNMSRLESGMLKPKADWCDIQELIHTITNKFSWDQHTLKIITDEDLPLVKMDAGLMEQVLHNIVHNAIQYTPPTSTITIAAKHQDGHFIISVSDSGTGIPAQDMKQVFDKFYRLPNSKPGGSGLGLSIVRGFVEAMQGTVTLTTQPNGGANFTIDIPAEASFITNLKNE